MTGSKKCKVDEGFGDEKDIDLSVEGENMSVVDADVIPVSVKDTDMSPVSHGMDIKKILNQIKHRIYYTISRSTKLRSVACSSAGLGMRAGGGFPHHG